MHPIYATLRIICVASTVALCIWLSLGGHQDRNGGDDDWTVLIALLALIPFGFESSSRTSQRNENAAAAIRRVLSSRHPSVWTFCILTPSIPYLGMLSASGVSFSALLGGPLLFILGLVAFIEGRLLLSQGRRRWLDCTVAIPLMAWCVWVVSVWGPIGRMETLAIAMMPLILAFEFLWLRWITYLEDTPRTKRSLRRLALLPCVTLLIPIGWQLCFSQIPFDSKKWQDSGSWTSDATRWRMTDDLIENHLRKGMTSDQVFSLLGSDRKKLTLKPSWPVFSRTTTLRIEFHPLMINRKVWNPENYPVSKLTCAYLGVSRMRRSPE